MTDAPMGGPKGLGIPKKPKAKDESREAERAKVAALADESGVALRQAVDESPDNIVGEVTAFVSEDPNNEKVRKLVEFANNVPFLNLGLLWKRIKPQLNQELDPLEPIPAEAIPYFQQRGHVDGYTEYKNSILRAELQKIIVNVHQFASNLRAASGTVVPVEDATSAAINFVNSYDAQNAEKNSEIIRTVAAGGSIDLGITMALIELERTRPLTDQEEQNLAAVTKANGDEQSYRANLMRRNQEKLQHLIRSIFGLSH